MRQNTATYFHRREVGAKQDDAGSLFDSVLQMLNADHFCDGMQVSIACPAAQARFDNAHSECLEMIMGQCFALCGCQVWKTQLDIAAYDGPSGSAETKCYSSEHAADGKRRAVW